jgi:hypothetical protein
MRHSSEPEHQLALHGSSGVIRDDGRIECVMVFDIFQSNNNDFGSQSVPDRILPRPLFAAFGFRSGAHERILRRLASICRKEVIRSCPSVFLDTEVPASAADRGSRRLDVELTCPVFSQPAPVLRLS